MPGFTVPEITSFLKHLAESRSIGNLPGCQIRQSLSQLESVNFLHSELPKKCGGGAQLGFPKEMMPPGLAEPHSGEAREHRCQHYRWYLGSGSVLIFYLEVGISFLSSTSGTKLDPMGKMSRRPFESMFQR